MLYNTKTKENNGISVIIPSTLPTYKRCEKRIIEINNESYIKPYEVIIISEKESIIKQIIGIAELN